MTPTLSRRTSLAGRRPAPARALARLARAQAAWPDRPMRLVVPFGAGGAIDTLSRTVANALPRGDERPDLVVENRAGAGGTIAGQPSRRSGRTAATLMMADLGANAIGKVLHPNLAYDPATAFTPIIHLVNLPIVVIVPAASRVRTLDDLAALARSRADGITYASPGVGHVSHLAAELLARRAGREVHRGALSQRRRRAAQRASPARPSSPSPPSRPRCPSSARRRCAPSPSARRARCRRCPACRPSDALPGLRGDDLARHQRPGRHGPRPGARASTPSSAPSSPTPRSSPSSRRARRRRSWPARPADFAALVAGDIAKWTPVIREGNIRAE
jgi:hypothetical protein